MGVRRLRSGLLLGLGTAAALACAGTHSPEADRAYQVGVAPVERVDAYAWNTIPASAQVVAYGKLPNTCMKLGRAHQQRLAGSIDVTLTTRYDFGPDCAEEPRPFEQRILLDVAGLPPGLYVVRVNGVVGTFQLFDDPTHLLNQPRMTDPHSN